MTKNSTLRCGMAVLMVATLLLGVAQPLEIDEKMFEETARLAAVKNVNLRKLFKPLIDATDSTRLTNYIDSVIDRFNMRSNPEAIPVIPQTRQEATTPKPQAKEGPQKKENDEGILFHPKGSLLTKMNFFKDRNSNNRKNDSIKVGSNDKLILPGPSGEPPVKNKIVRESLRVKNKTGTSAMKRRYPFDLYTSLQRLRGGTKNPNKEIYVPKVLKELEEVTRTNGIKDLTELANIFNDIVAKYKQNLTRFDSPPTYYEVLTKSQNSTKQEKEKEDPLTKAALLEVELPFYYPDAAMPSFKHIAGATALGALALGALFATPFGTGILRRSDGDEAEEQQTWLDSLSFWDDTNGGEGHDAVIWNQDHSHNDFYNKYFDFSDENGNPYNMQHYQNYFSTPDNNNEDPYYYYQNDRSTSDYTGLTYHTPNHYQYTSNPYYSSNRAEHTAEDLQQGGADEETQTVPFPYTFNVQDSYHIREGEPNLDTPSRSVDVGQQHHRSDYRGKDGSRYVTVEEVNKIAEESLKEILRNYQLFIGEDTEPSNSDQLRRRAEPMEKRKSASSYSSFEPEKEEEEEEDYSSDWQPKIKPAEKTLQSRSVLLGSSEGDRRRTRIFPEDRRRRGPPARRNRRVPLRRKRISGEKNKGIQARKETSEATRRIPKRSTDESDDLSSNHHKYYKRPPNAPHNNPQQR